ncbi:Aste57867_24215 [Aphanomyces stellatus]|uniref:Aste57867_24215 protein n=1 Tax=Aphanomyces stellatus TaxID=120398 RepID=A0A485LPR1_9STRA|nr:hypothetical protein As57867_024140 [Aphanomyces stellatus]VFU00856.1 Aste57867_24215 [Aphanomyces stellatus]
MRVATALANFLLFPALWWPPLVLALRAVQLPTPGLYHFQGPVATTPTVSDDATSSSVWQSPPIFQSDAVTISLQLSATFLPDGSYILLRPLTNDTANGSTHFPSGVPYDRISLPRLYANYVVLEIHATSPVVRFTSNHSLQIDGYNYVTSDELLAQTQALGQKEQACGADDSVHAVCRYNQTTPTRSMYAYSRPVVRITVNPNNPAGSDLCTGWLWGSEGHLITNNHCIGNVADAKTAQFEFLAEAFDCNAAIASTCPGVVEAISATFITTNVTLDYTLLKLNKSLAIKYGYLQATSPTTRIAIGLPIYIPQHPRGGCKLISSVDDDKASPVRLTSLQTPGCDNKGGFKYNADTDGGSSGSPVLSVGDNTVVALHYCGGTGCNNAGIPMASIVTDLLAKQLLPPCAVAPAACGKSTYDLPAFADPRIDPMSSVPPFFPVGAYDGIIRRLGTTTKSYRTTVDLYEFTLAAAGLVVVDILSYEIDQVANVYKDLNNDCRFNFFDSNVYVYSKDPKAPLYKPYFNDDVDESLHPTDGKADGSVSKKDSYLLVSLPKGTHIVSVGVSNLASADAVAGTNNYRYAALESCVGDNPASTAQGTYRLTLSSTVALNVTRTPPPIAPSACATPLPVLQAQCAAEQAAYFARMMGST